MSTDRQRWEAKYQTKAADAIRPPSGFLVEHLDQLPRGRALDVACGDGRHAIHLARHGYAVDAIDIALSGLRRAREVLRRERLSVNLIQADLEDCPLPRDRYSVVINIRYLQRNLLPALKHALRDGGVIVFETFLADQASISRPSNPAFLLDRGELRRAFQDFDILFYEEGLFDSEGGQAFLARLLARRPTSWTPR